MGCGAGTAQYAEALACAPATLEGGEQIIAIDPEYVAPQGPPTLLYIRSPLLAARHSSRTAERMPYFCHDLQANTMKFFLEKHVSDISARSWPVLDGPNHVYRSAEDEAKGQNAIFHLDCDGEAISYTKLISLKDCENWATQLKKRLDAPHSALWDKLPIKGPAGIRVRGKGGRDFTVRGKGENGQFGNEVPELNPAPAAEDFPLEVSARNDVYLKDCCTVLSSDKQRLFQIRSSDASRVEAEFVDLASKKTHKVVLWSPFMRGRSQVKDNNQNGTVWLGPVGKIGEGQCIARVESVLQHPELVDKIKNSEEHEGEGSWQKFQKSYGDGKPVGEYVISVSPGVDIALIFALCWVIDRLTVPKDNGFRRVAQAGPLQEPQGTAATSSSTPAYMGCQ